MNNSLGVLVTRPANQNQSLCAQLNQLGCRPFAAPTLKITPLAAAELAEFAALITRQPPPAWLIFVSANAVEHSWPLLSAQSNLLNQTLFAAVGRATADALRQRGAQVAALPDQQFDSDGLLALPVFSSPLDSRIMIIRGEGGQEYLAEQLRQRGAWVDYGECYRRELPEKGSTQLDEWLNDDVINVVTATSRATLRNLFELASEEFHTPLKRLPYVLLSPSLVTTAKNLGITGKLLIAAESSDTAICAAIEQLINA